MAKKPLVSIVTPSFNQGRFLERTIQSVLSQNYQPIEYIIIDGGSSDDSVEIINKFSNKLKYWVSEPDRGQTNAINKGFDHSNGQILAWLNSDDEYAPDAVTEAVDFLQDHPEIGLVYGDANFIDDNDRVIGKFPARQTDLKKLQRGYVHIPQQSAFFRADLWREVEPLDPNFFFAMDYDLWVRLSKISEIKYLPHTWSNFRLHTHAKTITTDERCWPEMLRVHYRNGGSWFAPIVFKYWLRKIASPWVNWRRRSMFH
jgi:glycosyltransferase involved in cell wall biosynthesis